MSNALRKCSFKIHTKGNNWKEVTGWFHQWGCDFEEFSDGPGNFTTAIVEDDTGKVHVLTSYLGGLETIKFEEQPCNVD